MSAQHLSSNAELPLADAEQFFALDLRVGLVVGCEPVPQARRPAYRMLIDFGDLGRRQSSARVTDNYQPAALVGTMVVAVVNLPPRQVGPALSQVLVLGAYQDGGDTVALLRPDRPCRPGDRVG